MDWTIPLCPPYPISRGLPTFKAPLRWLLRGARHRRDPVLLRTLSRKRCPETPSSDDFLSLRFPAHRFVLARRVAPIAASPTPPNRLRPLWHPDTPRVRDRRRETRSGSGFRLRHRVGAARRTTKVGVPLAMWEGSRFARVPPESKRARRTEGAPSSSINKTTQHRDVCHQRTGVLGYRGVVTTSLTTAMVSSSA